MKIKGTLIEIGNILDIGANSGRGLRLQSDGEIIELTGLTEEECRTISNQLGKNLTISISEKSE